MQNSQISSLCRNGPIAGPSVGIFSYKYIWPCEGSVLVYPGVVLGRRVLYLSIWEVLVLLTQSPGDLVLLWLFIEETNNSAGLHVWFQGFHGDLDEDRCSFQSLHTFPLQLGSEGNLLWDRPPSSSPASLPPSLCMCVHRGLYVLKAWHYFTDTCAGSSSPTRDNLPWKPRKATTHT